MDSRSLSVTISRIFIGNEISAVLLNAPLCIVYSSLSSSIPPGAFFFHIWAFEFSLRGLLLSLDEAVSSSQDLMLFSVFSFFIAISWLCTIGDVYLGCYSFLSQIWPRELSWGRWMSSRYELGLTISVHIRTQPMHMWGWRHRGWKLRQVPLSYHCSLQHISVATVPHMTQQLKSLLWCPLCFWKLQLALRTRKQTDTHLSPHSPSSYVHPLLKPGLIYRHLWVPHQVARLPHMEYLHLICALRRCRAKQQHTVSCFVPAFLSLSVSAFSSHGPLPSVLPFIFFSY